MLFGGFDYVLVLLFVFGGVLLVSVVDVFVFVEEVLLLVSSVLDKVDMVLGKVIVIVCCCEEDLQKVLMLIIVFGGEIFEVQCIFWVQDLQQVLFSVNVVYIYVWQLSVVVCGIGNNFVSDGLEGSVGIYFDNVYLGCLGMVVFDLLDIE